MTLSMNELSGFLQLGPQQYPERPEGVQVIQRGPHGMRLSADPVRTREGKLRGSGFRWWGEMLNVPADQQWVSKMKVVGLLGMGANPLSTAYDYWFGGKVEDPKQNVPVGAGNPALDAARSALRSVVEQSDLCNLKAAESALTYARSRINTITDSTLRSIAEGDYAKASAYLSVAKANSREKCAKGKASFDARVRAAQDAAEVEGERYRREQGECSINNLQPCFDQFGSGAKKVAAIGAVVALGAVFLYGFGGGLGKGLASRKRR